MTSEQACNEMVAAFRKPVGPACLPFTGTVEWTRVEAAGERIYFFLSLLFPNFPDEDNSADQYLGKKNCWPPSR